MISWAVDNFFGSIPVWLWWVIGGGIFFVAFGILRIYVGSWTVAFSTAVAAAVTVITLGTMASSRKAGREAERQRAVDAAKDRAEERKKSNAEIDRLDDSSTDARLGRWLQDDKSNGRPGN